MKTILILFCGIILAGCASWPKPDDTDFHVKLVRKGPEKMLLEVWRREQIVVPGPDGYTGHHKVTYWAALAGGGPTFVNPHFADVPQEYHCIGTINVDLDHKLVSIDMRRIVSKPGEPQETQPHPANGVHRIEKITHGKPGDWWF
jgi:hypothetical protein